MVLRLHHSKLGNMNLEMNSNIILPSGRGKPRETERVINKDVENLEKVQEEARARLKAYLDRAEAEGKLESVVPNESGTKREGSLRIVGIKS